MSTITVKDRTTIYYKDWGKGPDRHLLARMAAVSDASDGQMLFLRNTAPRSSPRTGVVTAAPQGLDRTT